MHAAKPLTTTRRSLKFERNGLRDNLATTQTRVVDVVVVVVRPRRIGVALAKKISNSPCFALSSHKTLHDDIKRLLPRLVEI